MSSSVSDYSPQAVYDATVRHLASMAGPAVRQSTPGHYSCRYRGPGGSRCAVGFWIPDLKYSPKMEKKAIIDTMGSEIVRAALPEPLQTPRMIRLLGDLQEAHDYEMNWNLDDRTWRKDRLADALRQIARKRKLRTAVVKECFG